MSRRESRGIRASKRLLENIREVLEMKNTVFAIMILMFMSACVVVHDHVPPGQIKKQTAPGQMKKWK